MEYVSRCLNVNSQRIFRTCGVVAVRGVISSSAAASHRTALESAVEPHLTSRHQLQEV